MGERFCSAAFENSKEVGGGEVGFKFNGERGLGEGAGTENLVIVRSVGLVESGGFAFVIK